MAAGVIVVGVILIGIIVLNKLATIAEWRRGYRKGMRYEANAWMEAFSKIQPPNWQSLPDPDGVTGEQSVAQRKLYAEAYSRALTSIQVEMVVNRLEALKQEILKEMENA
jgi:hypothetical protein